MDRLRRTQSHVALAFAAALGLRLGASLVLAPEPAWDGVIYERAAAMLAEGDGYTLRMYAPEWRWALPTAFYPPGWPGALAAFKTLGLARGADLGLQALFGSLCVLGAAWLGARAGGHRGARFAAWAVALWPGGILMTASWMGEPLFTLGLLVALAPLALRPTRPAEELARYALSALLFGALALIRPTALPIAAFAIAARAWTVRPRHRIPRRAALALAAPAVLVMAAIPLAPWLERNSERLGEPVISTNAGANLYVGTLGPRFARVPDAIDCPAGIRELPRDRCFRARAHARVQANPLGWMELGAEKLFHTFGYEAAPALLAAAARGVPSPATHPGALGAAALCTLYWLALAGLALRSRARPRVRAIVWGSVSALAVVHFVFLGGDRYHLPLVPLLAAISSRGALALGRRPRPRAPTA